MFSLMCIYRSLATHKVLPFTYKMKNRFREVRDSPKDYQPVYKARFPVEAWFSDLQRFQYSPLQERNFGSSQANLNIVLSRKIFCNLWSQHFSEAPTLSCLFFPVNKVPLERNSNSIIITVNNYYPLTVIVYQHLFFLDPFPAALFL